MSNTPIQEIIEGVFEKHGEKRIEAIQKALFEITELAATLVETMDCEGADTQTLDLDLLNYYVCARKSLKEDSHSLDLLYTAHGE